MALKFTSKLMFIAAFGAAIVACDAAVDSVSGPAAGEAAAAPSRKLNDNIVVIGAWSSFPIPTGEPVGQEPAEGEEPKEVAIPNGTHAEVLEWHEFYTEPQDSIYAEMEMWNASKVRILNGPLKDREMMVSHLYMRLAD